MNLKTQPLAAYALAMTPTGDSSNPYAQPEALPPGVMGNAYASSRQGAGVAFYPAPQPPITQREVTQLEVPPPASSGTTEGRGKAHAGKRKRQETEQAQETPQEEGPAYVAAGVWKAAKKASTDLAIRAGIDKEIATQQATVLDIALQTGVKGRAVGQLFLQKYTDTPANRLWPQVEAQLCECVRRFLPTQSWTPESLADALDLVRQLPTHHRPGEPWRVSDMALTLLPLAAQLGEAERQKLATAIAILAAKCPGAQAEGRKEANHAQCLEGLDPADWGTELGIRQCVSRLMLGKLTVDAGAAILGAILASQAGSAGKH